MQPAGHVQQQHVTVVLSEDIFLALGRKRRRVKRELEGGLFAKGFCSFLRAQVENGGQLAQ